MKSKSVFFNSLINPQNENKSFPAWKYRESVFSPLKDVPLWLNKSRSYSLERVGRVKALMT